MKYQAPPKTGEQIITAQWSWKERNQFRYEQYY